MAAMVTSFFLSPTRKEAYWGKERVWKTKKKNKIRRYPKFISDDSMSTSLQQKVKQSQVT